VAVEERLALHATQGTLPRVSLRFAATMPLLLAAALSPAGCGSTSDSEQVRAVVERFGAASVNKDYQRICDELISVALVAKVEKIGLPCEIAFKRGLSDVRNPRLKVRSVRVNKDRAFVKVHTTATGQKASDDTMKLVREHGEWRIASLAG
jgi:hypothetical protein